MGNTESSSENLESSSTESPVVERVRFKSMNSVIESQERDRENPKTVVAWDILVNSNQPEHKTDDEMKERLEDWFTDLTRTNPRWIVDNCLVMFREGDKEEAWKEIEDGLSPPPYVYSFEIEDYPEVGPKLGCFHTHIILKVIYKRIEGYNPIILRDPIVDWYYSTFGKKCLVSPHINKQLTEEMKTRLYFEKQQ